MNLLDQMRAVKLPEGLTLEPDPHNSRVLVAQGEHDGCTDDVLLMYLSDATGRSVTVHGWGRTGPAPANRLRYVRCHPEDLQGAVDYVLGLLDGVRP